MTKFVRSIALAAAIAGLVSAASLPSAPAQEKKKDAKKEAMKDDVKGAVEVYKDKAGDYRFKIVGEDGKALAMTTKGYDKKEDAIKALDMVKSILNHAKVSDGKDADEDKKEKKK